jgi:hypothetical protein
MTAHVCGIDIGKTVFHLIGLSKGRPHCRQEAFQSEAVDQAHCKHANVFGRHGGLSRLPLSRPGSGSTRTHGKT